jgi:hypothetical protein
MSLRLILRAFMPAIFLISICEHCFALDACRHDSNESIDVGAPVQLYVVSKGILRAYRSDTIQPICDFPKNALVKAYCGPKQSDSFPGISFQICETTVRYYVDPTVGKPVPPTRVLFYGKTFGDETKFPCYDESPDAWRCTEAIRVHQR